MNSVPGLFSGIILLIIFDLIFRGMALWRSAKHSQKWWFIALLVINSVAILPIIYLLTHPDGKKGKNKKEA